LSCGGWCRSGCLQKRPGGLAKGNMGHCQPTGPRTGPPSKSARETAPRPGSALDSSYGLKDHANRRVTRTPSWIAMNIARRSSLRCGQAMLERRLLWIREFESSHPSQPVRCLASVAESVPPFHVRLIRRQPLVSGGAHGRRTQRPTPWLSMIGKSLAYLCLESGASSMPVTARSSA
jgi:hypothetical protein